jgi:hypothetical protein
MSGVNAVFSGTVSGATVSGTSLVMNGTPLTNLIDQDLRTSATPTFVGTSFQWPIHIPLYAATISGTGADLVFNSNSSPFAFSSNGTTALKIASVPSGSTQTASLMINPSTKYVEYRSDGVFTAASQTLTNKTIDSASNTLQVNGTSINSLINQDVRTSATPQFAGLSITPTAPGTPDINILTVGPTFPATITRRSVASLGIPVFGSTSVNITFLGMNIPVVPLMSYQVVGSMVMFKIPYFGSTKVGNGAIYTAAGQLAMEIRPSQNFPVYMPVTLSSGVGGNGQMFVFPDGHLEIYANTSQGLFTNGNLVGSGADVQVSYLL